MSGVNLCSVDGCLMNVQPDAFSRRSSNMAGTFIKIHCNAIYTVPLWFWLAIDPI
jgi:hypothetical protein